MSHTLRAMYLPFLLLLVVAVLPWPGLAADDLEVVFLPIVMRQHSWELPFGTECGVSLAGTLLQRADELNVTWMRFNRRSFSWRQVQPTEGGPYDWSALSTFEEELRAARQAGITPIVVMQHSPTWATINQPFETDCGAIRPDKLGAFAAFMQAAVSRYSQPEFNVHYWELFNEPDVDPTLVPVNNVFGCWGNIADPYYGGQQYGEMLKVVTPAIKAVDPGAKVVFGGLLLAKPVPNTYEGHPELFLEGALSVGAAPYFDILAYHAYPSYVGQAWGDYDVGPGPWQSWGGWTVGKARFLQQSMAKYGVDKPLFLNETALACNPDYYACNPPSSDFFEAQADYLVRTFSRARSEKVQGFVWYTLNGPGWRSTGLLDGSYNPRPAYRAYQNLIARQSYSNFEMAVDYGAGVEAYSFVRQHNRLHVLWSTDAVTHTITVAQSQLLAAYDRDGASLTPTPVGSDYQFQVGFSPIYLELRK